MDSPVARAAHEARVRVSEALPRASVEVERATAKAVSDYRRDIRHDAERHIKLVDASLGVIARKLKADEVRVSVRDIPVLLECRDKLVGVVGGTHAGANNGPIVETARVKHARETGGDLVTAMHEDAQELVSLLGAMVTAASVDLQALSDAEQQVRGEA